MKLEPFIGRVAGRRKSRRNLSRRPTQRLLRLETLEPRHLLTDLIVGEKTAAGTGKIRVYLNSDTNADPVYGSFVFAQGSEGDVSVPAIGCLGVFPRVFDWNQDGKQDLVLGLADGTIQVLLNEGTVAEPRFGTPTLVQVGPPDGKTTCDVGDRATFAIVDWNNDGGSDMVLGGLDGKVHVLLNEATAGAPDFRSDSIVLDGANPLSVSSGRAAVAVVDLNDDGRKDLVLGNTEGQLVYFANVGTDASPQFNGSQLLQADGAVIDLSGIPRSRPFVADVNGDGVPDMLVGAMDGLVRQYIGARPSGATAPDVGDAGGSYVYAFRVEEAANPWQCPVFPLDVNHDGLITPLDALIVINYLNEHGPGDLVRSRHGRTGAAALSRRYRRPRGHAAGRPLGHQRNERLRSARCATSGRHWVRQQAGLSARWRVAGPGDGPRRHCGGRRTSFFAVEQRGLRPQPK